MRVVSCFDSFLAKQNSKISLFRCTTRAPWNREIMEMTQPCYHLYIFNVFLFINFWQTLVSTYWVCALVEWKKIVLIKPQKSRRRKGLCLTFFHTRKRWILANLLHLEIWNPLDRNNSLGVSIRFHYIYHYIRNKSVMFN